MSETRKIEDEILAFNWTKVELKLYNGEIRDNTKKAFNWTKVELKHILIDFAEASEGCF